MNPVLTPRQRQKREARLVAAKAPMCLKNTLYDVTVAVQSVVEPDEDDLSLIVNRCNPPTQL
jgi:hypothetical protein